MIDRERIEMIRNGVTSGFGPTAADARYLLEVLDLFMSSSEEVLGYWKSLSEEAQKYYLSQQEIDSLQPMELKTHEGWRMNEAAMIMVSERHRKGDLVALVHALLVLGNRK